jgi:uncharacterized membrane protein
MTIGPVQLVVLGFVHPNFHREIVAELRRLKEADTINVIDAQAVYKDAGGNIEIEHLSTLSLAEQTELGSRIAALIGLPVEGEEQVDPTVAAGLGGETAREPIDESSWDVLAALPNDSAAALLMLEHRWAIPLRDAIARTGGFRIDDGFISPLDLIQIGLLSAEEAKDLHDLEQAGRPAG